MCWRHFLFQWRFCSKKGFRSVHEWLVACCPCFFFLLPKHLFVFASYLCRPAWVWHAKEPRGERIPDENALLLWGKSSGTAAVAMAPVDGVQLSLWLGADLCRGSKWEVAHKRQKDFYQRQVWGQRGESLWFKSLDPSVLFHITSHYGLISKAS